MNRRFYWPNDPNDDSQAHDAGWDEEEAEADAQRPPVPPRTVRRPLGPKPSETPDKFIGE